MDLAYACVCCGYRTLSEPPGSHEICPVCGWEDDVYQLRWPDRTGGANRSSLIVAQRAEADRATHGKADRAGTGVDVADFDREPFWRPIDRRDRFEPPGGDLAPWPDDWTVLYWWRRRAGTTWWETVASAVLDFDQPGNAQAAEFADTEFADTEFADTEFAGTEFAGTEFAGTEFADAVRAVAAVAPPADPDNLSGMQIDFDHYLGRCPSILEVAVSSRPDPACRLTARCRAEMGASPHRVAADIQEVWLQDLRYRHWEAHSLQITPTSVRLDVATQVGEGGYFITGAIIVEWA